MAAAIFGDQASLERHTAEAVPLVSASPTEYPGAVARVLRGLALAGQIRATDGAARDTLLSELDEVTRWLADRAADAPQNFLHLLRLLEAERAWAVGDFQGCVRGFDAALHGAGQRPRPWHRALITERAARFYLAHGLDHDGYDLLTQARQQYAAWGATAKVAQLDWAYPSLPPHQDTAAAQRNTRSPDDSLGSGSVSTGTIDLLGILSTSQALSSETSIAGLHARVAQVLGAMTGATDVALLVWNDEHRRLAAPSDRPTTVARRRATQLRCRCCATSNARVSHWSCPTPPVMTASPATPTSPMPTAAHCWLSRSSAEASCGRCCCWRTG